jgi:diacylglycerol O-acyltransferase
VVSVDRLTADDLLMLWPDRIWPQEVGGVGILDGAALLEPDGGFRTEAVREAVGERLHRVPRLRQRLCTPRRGLGRPLWVDAPDFDIADHVRVARLRPPAGEGELLRTVERLRRRRLDLRRPPWEMWLLPGLPEGRVGPFLRFHHVLADGIAGVATMGALLDAAPEPQAGPAQPWHPDPAPTAREPLADWQNPRRWATGAAAAVAALAVRRARLSVRATGRRSGAGAPWPVA